MNDLTLASQLYLQVGQRRYAFSSYAEASTMFCEVRDVSGLGSSEITPPAIVDETNKAIGWVSYNGRVWSGDPGDFSNETTTLLYCPSGEPCPYTRLRSRG